MVVLSAAVCTKAGKALLSRQFVEVTRIRIEGLLAAFPKLIGSGPGDGGSTKQHTYVETENVRYVYQPLEGLYILMITTKNSNIMEDLETLRLLAKVVPEYAQSLEETNVVDHAFEIIFAFDEIISLGYRENITLQGIKTNLEMESHEEKLHNMIRQSKMNDAKEEMKRKVEGIEKQKAADLKMAKSIQGAMGPGGSAGGWTSSQSLRREQDELAARAPRYGAPPTEERPTAPSPAAARPAGKGMQLGSKAGGGRTNDLLAALKAEGEIVEEAPPVVMNKVANKVETPTDPVVLVVDEKLVVQMDRDGGLQNMEVKGDLSLRVADPDAACLKLLVKQGANKGYQFKAHPNVDKNALSNDNALMLKDPSRPFPTGSPLGILKWRYQTKDEKQVPLTINCWPSTTGGLTYVNLEYELLADIPLSEVQIAIPIPCPEPPKVSQMEHGEYKLDGRSKRLIWRLELLDESNKTGSMEFAVPGTIDAGGFFPVLISFVSPRTFCDFDVVGAQSTLDGRNIRYSKTVSMQTEEFVIA
eukprot:tig00020610_g11958.t1